MTPASNSEARKRALIGRAQEWHATRNKPTDPVDRLRALADEIAEEDLTDSDVTAWRRFIADRLHALINQVEPAPQPTTEHVRLDQVIGRRLSRFPEKGITYVTGQFPDRWTWRDEHGGWRALHVEADGTVEVLVEDES